MGISTVDAGDLFQDGNFYVLYEAPSGFRLVHNMVFTCQESAERLAQRVRDADFQIDPKHWFEFTPRYGSDYQQEEEMEAVAYGRLVADGTMSMDQVAPHLKSYL
jgi:hypothetical protein